MEEDLMPNEQAPANSTSSPAERAANHEALKARLDRLEKTTGNSGAVPLTPKAMMLASDLPEKHPDKHYRWVNVKDGQKAASRIMEGYERVAEGDGGRSLGGSLALFAIPREQYEARLERQQKLTIKQMDAHKSQMYRLAEGISRTLRDRHGLNVPVERLLVSERE